jgi:hypothetical protein
MRLLTRRELRALSEERGDACVSLYIATHRAGAEIQQDPIRLKNLLKEAEATLITMGLRSPDAGELLEPAQALLEDHEFWQHQSDGLALFLSPGSFRGYRLPFKFDELVVVTNRFHVKPLLPLLSGDGRFYVLALSQNEVRMLQGTRYSVAEVDLEDVPKSLAEALRYDDPERQLQFHTQTQTPGGRGDRGAAFHGHGVVSDEDKEDILRFFQKVDEGLQDVLGDEQSPLVLAGVEYLLPIYAEANTYSNLISGGVKGNPEALGSEDLHKRAWEIVEPHFQEAQVRAIARYEQLASTEQASSDVRTVVPAAHHGRVDTLFVAVGQQHWGAFDPQTNTIEIHGEEEPGDEDLLDLAAVQTLLHGGKVYALEPAEVPDGVPVAAVFRY